MWGGRHADDRRVGLCARAANRVPSGRTHGARARCDDQQGRRVVRGLSPPPAHAASLRTANAQGRRSALTPERRGLRGKLPAVGGGGTFLRRSRATAPGPPPCQESDQMPLAKTLLQKNAARGLLISKLSTRDLDFAGQSGHDQFFAAFGGFGAASNP